MSMGAMRHEDPTPQRDEIAVLCREILAFVAARPDARDTLEGIADWWILENRIRREAAKVRLAVGRLVDEGLLVERRGPNGRSHYSVNHDRLDEVRARIHAGGAG